MIKKKKQVSILLLLHKPSQLPPRPNQLPLIRQKKSKKWAQSCRPQRSLSQRRAEVRAQAPGFHRCRQVAGYFFFPLPRFPTWRPLSPATLSNVTSGCGAGGTERKEKPFTDCQTIPTHLQTVRGSRVIGNFQKIASNLIMISFRCKQLAGNGSSDRDRGGTHSVFTIHPFESNTHR